MTIYGHAIHYTPRVYRFIIEIIFWKSNIFGFLGEIYTRTWVMWTRGKLINKQWVYYRAYNVQCSKSGSGDLVWCGMHVARIIIICRYKYVKPDTTTEMKSLLEKWDYIIFSRVRMPRNASVVIITTWFIFYFWYTYKKYTQRSTFNSLYLSLICIIWLSRSTVLCVYAHTHICIILPIHKI